MRKVVLGPDQQTIEVQHLTGREIVCYLSSKTNTPKILAKLTGGRHDPSPEKWGFVSIAYPTGDVVFASDTFIDAARKCLQGGREVFTFENYREFLIWLTVQPIYKT